ncbi:MAG: 4Fe-4S dicluster domain-containing protein [Deltaproteobacteria bacterium]|nr:4Fe-4S dicluster domain-containing protein [Deltaproteobacteria bacterium]
MKIRLSGADIDGPRVKHIERVTGEDLKHCYQCGKCSAGCPVSYLMEVPPSRVMRLLQLGRVDDVEAANTMWVCVGCVQCYARCPKGCSVASVLEGMRQIQLRKGTGPTLIKDIPIPFLRKAPQQALVCGFRKFVG